MARWILLPRVLPLLLLTACSSADTRRQAAFERADHALQAGSPERAVAILTSVLRFDPRDFRVTTRLAEIHLDQARPGLALALLQAVPADVEVDSAFYSQKAQALLRCGQVQQASAILIAQHQRGISSPAGVDELLRIGAVVADFEPHDLPTPWRARLVEQRIQARYYKAALRSWRLLDATVTGKPQLFELLLHHLVLHDDTALLRQIHEVGQAPISPWKLLARHRLLVVDGAAGQAAEIEKQFLQRYPDHPQRFDMLLSSARRQASRGAASEALSLARRASALHPDRVEPWIEQALALDALDRGDEAELALQRILGIDGDHPVALSLLRRRDEQRRGASQASGELTLSVRGGG